MSAIEDLAAAMHETDRNVRESEDPVGYKGSTWDNAWLDLQPYNQELYLHAARRIAAGASNYGACGDPATKHLVDAARREAGAMP